MTEQERLFAILESLKLTKENAIKGKNEVWHIHHESIWSDSEIQVFKSLLKKILRANEQE